MRIAPATFVALAASVSPAAAAYLDGNVAVMQGLDKITARVWTFDAPVNKPTHFGTLTIEVTACRKRPPEEPPETAGYVRVIDERRDRQSQQIFKGWMFASTPALSALEHPVYDVWVVDCKLPASVAPQPSPPATPTPPAVRRAPRAAPTPPPGSAPPPLPPQ